jgi:hypothetical protein
MNAISQTAPSLPLPPLSTNRSARRRSAGIGVLGLGVAALLGSALRLRPVQRSRESTLMVGGAALTIGLLALHQLDAARAKPIRTGELT